LKIFFYICSVNNTEQNKYIMKTLETLKQEFITLETNYKANPLPMGTEYNSFAKKWKSLKSQIKNYDNSTNIMKRDGLKVSKSGVGYKVEFQGIVAELWLDGCVTDYWAIDVVEGDLDFEFMEHETKSDAIWYLYNSILSNN